MPVFSVDSERCHADGICALLCPANVIKGPVGHVPVMRPEKAQDCIACGHCMAFCPHGAARVDVLPQEELLPLDRTRLPDAESVELLCRARRSIRHFRKEALPRELLERILAAARHSPSARNRQPVRWLVVYERESLAAIGTLMAEWMEATPSGQERPLPQSFARQLAGAWRNGMDPFFRGAPHLLLAVTPREWEWGSIDAAISLTYVEIAALPHEVGACWAGYVTIAAQHCEALRRFLGLAEEEVVSGGQMLGRIGLHPAYSAPRKAFPVQWL